MHKNSMDIMKSLIGSYLREPLKNYKIADIGSCNVNGTYKDLIKPNWTYHGIDITKGPNVDIVVDESYVWPMIKDNEYDVVISGSCLEHVRMPWEIILSMKRITKLNGFVIIVAPFICGPHNFPIDCWRFLPEGLVVLASDIAKMKILEAKLETRDTYCVAQKV